jgi:predicted aconitase
MNLTGQGRTNLIDQGQMNLTEPQRAMLEGESSAAAALAMRLLLRLGQTLGATEFLEISQAHIDGCLYHGQVSLDFIERMHDMGAAVCVPTTLNVGSLTPRLENHQDPQTSHAMQRQMDLYAAIGCQATWTCAPYQLPSRPNLGEQIAWAESNAIVFANSVLGARTNRYGDFIDLCAAITGCVPAAGLHLTANRHGQVVYKLELGQKWCQNELLFAVLGHAIGLDCGTAIPVLDGLEPTASQDDWKAFGASAASSGGVAMFHAVGHTPEAPDLETALHHQAPARVVHLNDAWLDSSRQALTGVAHGEQLEVVMLGTPHYSLSEFERLLGLLHTPVHADVRFYVNTNRYVYAALEQRDWVSRLEALGVRLVLDTCTYFTRIIGQPSGAVLTSSGKAAHYAPNALGVRIGLGSTAECVQSAIAGRVVYD